ncbi:hypothetical protein IQ63_05335 [Streptomyces acidiscabies]|uniref:Uncharacterized protein n=1 Tax=Streptomyces acidiscabies TaxID=42234 RepID=A0A0L0KL45_9ACTN|nr:hypothetical protein IQ63_05335 [Streptomyces acidiscabies]
MVVRWVMSGRRVLISRGSDGGMVPWAPLTTKVGQWSWDHCGQWSWVVRSWVAASIVRGVMRGWPVPSWCQVRLSAQALWPKKVTADWYEGKGVGQLASQVAMLSGRSGVACAGPASTRIREWARVGWVAAVSRAVTPPRDWPRRMAGGAFREVRRVVASAAAALRDMSGGVRVLAPWPAAS